MLLAAALALAAHAAPDQREAQLEVPLLDQAVGRPLSLGPDQAMALAYGPYRAAALGLREGSHALFENEVVATGVGLTADYALAFFGRQLVVLAHEEWHLAALREGGVSGTDLFLQGEIVDVDDDALAAFKRANPAGLVRAHSAGIEYQNAYVRRIGDEAFLHGGEGFGVGPFRSAQTWMAPHAQATELNTFQYLAFCASPETDDVIAFVEGLQADPADRDFTGPDCTAWARDLNRPDEPYEARGAHASGDGIGRAVGWSDLTADEQALLKQQVGLHALSLVNPHLLGIDRIELGDSAVIAQLQHQLTPYGWAVDLHGGWKADGPAVLGTVRLGRSGEAWYPAVEVAVADLALSDRVVVDASAEGWVQPRDLRWGGEPVPGGRVGARVGWRLADRVDAWASVDAKSAGWAVGLAPLDAAVVGRFGATAQLGRVAAR